MIDIDIDIDIDLKELSEIDSLYFPTPWKVSNWKNLNINNSDSNTIYYYVNQIKENNIVNGFSLYHVNLVSSQAHLLKIIVKPLFRKRGIAKNFLVEDIQNFKKKQIESIFLEVETLNSVALKLYHSLGFTIINKIKNFYPNKIDAFSMILNISN